MEDLEISEDGRTLISCPRSVSGHLVIPDGIAEIGKDAFYLCKGLTSIEIPNSVTHISGFAFYGCEGLTSLKIPSSIDKIEKLAFACCTALTSLEIPNSVVEICKYAFLSCGAYNSTFIDKLYLPDHIEKLGSAAFAFAKIKELHIRHEHPEQIEVANDAFEKCAENCTLYVPVGTEYAYRHHPVFGKFKEVVIEY